MFSLAHPAATADILRAAERLLKATGEAVVLSANFGPAALHGDEEW